jgi:hypothetical protein
VNLFVYYKFVPSEACTVKERVISMQTILSAEFELSQCALMKRPEPDEQGRETWMEVYECPDSQSEAFERRLSFLAQENHLPQPRRDEIFFALNQK